MTLPGRAVRVRSIRNDYSPFRAPDGVTRQERSSPSRGIGFDGPPGSELDQRKELGNLHQPLCFDTLGDRKLFTSVLLVEEALQPLLHTLGERESLQVGRHFERDQYVSSHGKQLHYVIPDGPDA